LYNITDEWEKSYTITQFKAWHHMITMISNNIDKDNTTI